MPASIQDRLRGSRHSSTPTSSPPQIDFPADVADKEQVRAYLLDTPVGGDARIEIEGYVTDAIDRFRVTMALVPPLEPGARVLELGAGPYFLTRLLLRRGLDVTCANWFGPEMGAKGREVIERSNDGEDVTVEYDNFNVETDRFPYDDDSFDLVLCCEILEHLPSDPIQMLAEIHRVLRKDSGTLLLTTPNAVRMMNLVHMLNGDNVYEQYSGYGAYGRHNREFTVEELRRLFTEAGYQVSQVVALDVHTNMQAKAPRLKGANYANRGDNLFAVATPIGRRRWPYNEWLYASQHALEHRVVQPNVVMSENGYLQTTGLHPIEHIGGEGGDWASWTGYAPRATVTLAPAFSGPGDLVIDGISAPAAAGRPITLFAAIGDKEVSWPVDSTGQRFQVSSLVEAGTEPQQVQLWTDTSWVPAEVGLGGDRRKLGVALVAVSLHPAAD
jgi:2-polyprenyl-3-methyl-5-hydroxy-6-metoxy-1,4-benzoquinol methylase